MLTYKVASALKPGDEVVVPWPDWIHRMAVVIKVEPAVKSPGKGTYTPQVWKITVQFLHGKDNLIHTDLYRGMMEMLPVIVNVDVNIVDPKLAATRESVQKKRRAKRIEDREKAKEYQDPSQEDEELTAQYENQNNNGA